MTIAFFCSLTSCSKSNSVVTDDSSSNSSEPAISVDKTDVVNSEKTSDETGAASATSESTATDEIKNSVDSGETSDSAAAIADTAESRGDATAATAEATSAGSSAGAAETAAAADEIISSRAYFDAPTAEEVGGADGFYSAVGDSIFDGESFFDFDYGDSVFEDSIADFAVDGSAGDLTVYSENPFVNPDYAISAGMLTGGEWCDNENWDYWLGLYNTNSQWATSARSWNMAAKRRFAVNVTAKGIAAENIIVELLDTSENTVWQARTDNKGNAYLFNTINAENQNASGYISVTVGSSTSVVAADKSFFQFDFEDEADTVNSLDLMLTIDTTGSMSDELMFLQYELEDVINRVKNNNNVDVNLSVNFYRDDGDQYVTLSNDFSSNIDSQLKKLNEQFADGGGDTPEAVDKALDLSINQSSWREKSTKLMLLVLDAPPHNQGNISSQIITMLQTAAGKGIRIIPVASSGIDKETEYLLRCYAAATGGTYVFLTDDSGIGGGHIEPTIGNYDVEMLNDLLVRIITDYIA